MIKAFVWGFDDIIVRDAIMNLKKNGQLDVKKWFVGDHYKEEFTDVECAEYFYDEFRSNYKDLDLLAVPLVVEKSIEKHCREIALSFSRDMYFYGKPFYEIQNVIHIVTRYYYTLLKKYDVDLVMFGDVPHGGWMLLLYYVAVSLQLKTFFCGPTRVENRFMYAFSLDDYGKFDDIPEYAKVDKVHIEEKIENNWFDMDEKWLKERKHGGLRRKIRLLFEPDDWYKERKEIFLTTKSKYGSISNMAQKKTIEILGRKMDKVNYKSCYNKNIIDDVDYNRKYVYYPLHLQPEMNTDTLGGVYSNQLFLLEQLSEIIPDDWVIYAKEHPLQTEYMRGEYFFKQLSMLPKVKLVSNQTDTYELNRHSQFVATLVGTTGWEAICGGKNALVFGKAWYGSLPGVFHYRDGITLDEIMSYKINHEEFEQAVAKLKRKMGIGIISNDSIPSVSNFNKDRNCKSVYDFLSFIIAYIENNG